MSLILDALRKSERTRQQTLSARVSASGSPFDHGRVPLPWATLIGLLLIANVVVLAVIFWRSPAPNSAPPPAVVPVAAQPVAVEAAVVYRPAVRSLADEAAASTQTVGSAIATPTAIPPATSRAASAAQADVAPATAAAAIRVAPVERPGVAAAGLTSTDTGVPLLDSLPPAFQQSLPALHLDVHSYSGNPANRFVVINMQRYRKGDTLAEGPKVVAIVADGVILEYHGRKFLLPRP